MINKKIIERSKKLYDLLTKAITYKKLKYNDIIGFENQGLYIVLKNEEIIYVGKTDRRGKVRIREMVSDYRSHTLNRKIFKEHLENITGRELPNFNIKTKTKLIEAGIISEMEFAKEQSEVNLFIKNNLTFILFEYNNPELINLEHYAIAMLNPKYND